MMLKTSLFDKRQADQPIHIYVPYIVKLFCCWLEWVHLLFFATLIWKTIIFTCRLAQNNKKDGGLERFYITAMFKYNQQKNASLKYRAFRLHEIKVKMLLFRIHSESDSWLTCSCHENPAPNLALSWTAGLTHWCSLLTYDVDWQKYKQDSSATKVALQEGHPGKF